MENLFTLIRNRTFWTLALSLAGLVLASFGVESDLDVEIVADRILGVITAIGAALALVGGWTVLQDAWNGFAKWWNSL